MEQRGLKGVLALTLIAAAASSCAGGDGVPTAAITNGFDTCIVEASFLNYGFIDPIGMNGTTESREVTIGSDVAYAVAMAPVGDENCLDQATKRNGTLWITNDKYATKAGQLTEIRFDKTTAKSIPTACTPDYVEGLKRFARLFNACDSDAGAPPSSQDAATEAAADAAAD